MFRLFKWFRYDSYLSFRTTEIPSNYDYILSHTECLIVNLIFVERMIIATVFHVSMNVISLYMHVSILFLLSSTRNFLCKCVYVKNHQHCLMFLDTCNYHSMMTFMLLNIIDGRIDDSFFELCVQDLSNFIHNGNYFQLCKHLALKLYYTTN